MRKDASNRANFQENIPRRNALLVLSDSTNVFDALVKLLIQGSGGPLRQLQLAPVVEWLNSDLPRTQSRQVDLLGRMSDKHLLHIELQATNLRSMRFRMAEYALAITRRYGQYPVQLPIYVGNPPLRMTPEYRTEGMVCSLPPSGHPESRLSRVVSQRPH